MTYNVFGGTLSLTQSITAKNKHKGAATLLHVNHITVL